ncbi:MAG: LysE family transporter [Clostridia bacterium]|nr:LysE family transporter [Clostridia bacterium]
MLILGLFAAAWVVSLSGALMPGPLLTITINESLHRGVCAGPLVVLGHAVLELALVVALLLGLQHVLTLPLVEFCLSLAGGGVLGILGLDLLRVTWRPPASLPWDDAAAVGSDARDRWFASVWAGMVTTVVNPYWELWWATIGAAMLVQAQAVATAGITAFYLGHVLGDLGWYTLVSLVVVSGRRWLSRGAYRWLMGGCGVFLLTLAVYFSYHALAVGRRLFV